MKRAAAQKSGNILQGEPLLSADNFRSPAFFRQKSGSVSYIQTGREADIAARGARILLKGENHEA